MNKKILIIILFLIFIGVGIFAVIKNKINDSIQIKNTTPVTEIQHKNINTPVSDEWISSNFKDAAYIADVSYPKNYILNCCGDMDTGTIHSLSTTTDENDPKPSHLITVLVTNGYYPDDGTGSGPVAPEIYYKSYLDSGKLKKINNVTTTELGTSRLALFTEKAKYTYAGHASFEQYIFTLKNKQSKNIYYEVTFYTPEEFSQDFKLEFLNKIKLLK